MNTTIFDRLLSAHLATSAVQKRNAVMEVMQQIALAGLHRGGFFDKAAFYGGTCLRVFHGLNRYSEDLDFSLTVRDDAFNIENYFNPLVDEFAMCGRSVTISKKAKKNFSKVESAFLKDNTEVYNLSFQTEKSFKIKIEVDTNPPMGFATEPQLLLQPYSLFVNCFTLPNLFAGKMHALIFRQWGNRIKGRDWYDFEWYVRNQVPLDFEHFCMRAKDFNGIELNKDDFYQLLQSRLQQADMNLVKQDVMPFLHNPQETTIWTNDYFLQLAKLIRFTK